MDNDIEVRKGLIVDTIETLERVGCQFWACPGPDAAFENMKTCYVCCTIADLKEAIKDK